MEQMHQDIKDDIQTVIHSGSRVAHVIHSPAIGARRVILWRRDCKGQNPTYKPDDFIISDAMTVLLWLALTRSLLSNGERMESVVVREFVEEGGHLTSDFTKFLGELYQGSVEAIVAGMEAEG